MRNIFTFLIIIISSMFFITDLFAQNPCSTGATVIHGGKTYNTVQIGSQCWMKENLDIGTMINNTIEQTKNNVVEKYCSNNLPANCTAYGGLYQWAELVRYYHNATNLTPCSPAIPAGQSVQGLCPDGWHIPTNADWQTLFKVCDPSFNYQTNPTSTIAGGYFKEAGTSHWKSPNTGATNSYGFSAFGGGYDNGVGSSFSFKENGYYANIYEFGFYSCTHIIFNYNNASADFMSDMKSNAVSVRCIKGNGVDAGIEDINLDINEMLDIFPIPANQVINFNFLKYHNKNINVYLVNIIGETVYQQSISKENFSLNNTINLDNISSGNYLLKVVIDGKNYTKKIVIEKNK